MMKMKIYLSGRYRARERIACVAQQLQLRYPDTIEVLGTWLSREEKQDPSYEDRQGYGLADLAELEKADALIVDTLDELPATEGRAVEFGYAYRKNLPTWVVGPTRNVFYTLVPTFSSWTDFQDTLDEYIYLVNGRVDAAQALEA